MPDAHVVALSGGKDSTALALRLAEVEPERDFTYVCTPTGDELPEMEAHWASLEERLGQPIQRVTAKHSLNGLIEHWNALPNHRMRWCTRVLKIEPFQAYMWKLAREYDSVTAYVGLRADEETREGVLYPTSHPDKKANRTLPEINQRFPLREWGWGIDDVMAYLQSRGITIPRRTDCARCFFQSLEEWRVLDEEHPDIFQEAVDQEAQTGYTFRSPTKDKNWPHRLEDLRAEFRGGRRPRVRKREGDACRVCSL